MPSQVDTRLNAIEFLSGQWAVKPVYLWDPEDLEAWSTITLIEVAHHFLKTATVRPASQAGKAMANRLKVQK